jgi:hypothetical protein
MYRYLTLFSLLLLVCADLAIAAPISTHTRTLNINGTSASPAPTAVNSTTGACNVSPWVDHCTGTNCSCIQVIPSSAGGSMDKGAQTVSDFFVTTDDDVNPAQNAPIGEVDGKCAPFFAVLTDTVASTGETKTLNLIGTSCKKITGISNKNPSGNHVGDSLNGAWGIASSPAPTPAASGWGTLTGTTTKSSNGVSIKLTGAVTQ